MRPEDEWRDLLDEDDDEEDEDEETEEKDREGEASVLKGLLKARTIILSGEINKKLAEKISTLLLVMEAEGDGPIKVFIDSPGGDADAGYGVLDMIRFVKSPVYTISNGLTASAGVIISLAAKPEHRFSLPNSRFLIHQPSSGMQGTASDIKIHAEEILKLKKRVNQLIADECGQEYEKVEEDIKRDRWLSPEEALEYGLISKIVTCASELENID
ncbi:MAG: ATP-dependent Clp protease proteolytic subunit [Planctomycetota bacterium]|jgi:ATP-dependent Clp protease protease subunit|nr:ATP-dependent Clp protease proteolytic subunit [Planctomycetota bacterium]MDP6505973.1 ATP-dependent Clp protease proteolytic subunit [Planctomycetota bacterium]